MLKILAMLFVFVCVKGSKTSLLRGSQQGELTIVSFDRDFFESDRTFHFVFCSLIMNILRNKSFYCAQFTCVNLFDGHK